MTKNVCFNFLFLFTAILLLNSCDNDLDVLSDYEENASVYGILDPSQVTQYIKINKVFTNPNAKASDVAKISDSLFFDSLTPFIIEQETGRRIPLYKVSNLPKDSGYFANAPNYLYATNERIYSRNPFNQNQNYSYRIEFELPTSKKKISASTNIVRDFFIQSPISPNPLIPRSINFPTNANVQLRFLSPLNGKVFDAFFNINYVEINKADTNIKAFKTIKWKILRSYRTTSDKGNEQITSIIPGISFYNVLLNDIKVDASVYREFLPCSMEIVGGNIEIDNYIQSSSPSIGIVQKQAEYSNIQNGIGIFGSRFSIFLDRIALSSTTRGLVANSNDYRQLGFVR
jgi:hypothetical protein